MNANAVVEQRTAHLHSVIDELIGKYRDLPSLLDTKADYTEDPAEALRLHRRAYARATEVDMQENLVMISATIASLYIGELGDADEATAWCDRLGRHLRRSPSESYRDELASIRSRIRSVRRQTTDQRPRRI